MKYLNKLATFSGKTVIVRLDLNTIPDINDFRILSHEATLRQLLLTASRVILLSHHGRPENINNNNSLRPFVPVISKILNETVQFVSHDPVVARKAVEKSGSKVYLLDNLRFNPGEDGLDGSFAEKLASLGDFFVNEAFSVSHRETASTMLLPRLLPSYAGLHLEAEIINLNTFLQRSSANSVLVIGGAKIKDKLGVINRLHDKVDNILLGGAAANPVLALRGVDIKQSLTDDVSLYDQALLLGDKINVPVDYVWQGSMIRDIGPNTMARYEKIIKNTDKIIWNGPMGYVEEIGFRTGTDAVMKCIADSAGYSVVGGGDTLNYIESNHYVKRFDFVSTGGGAMLEYLSGGSLPGINALENTT